MKKIIIFSFFLVAVLLSTCKKDDLPDPSPGPDVINFKGRFEQKNDDPLPISDLTILSLTDESGISPDGKFELSSTENDKYQIFIGNSNTTGETAYFGISDPGSGEVLVNDSTTALGLLLINPYLMGTEQEQRKQYLDQASTVNKFPLLIEAIAQARKSNPNDPLNMDQQPEMYQLVNDIMMSAIEKLAGGESEPKYGEECIKIIDRPGKSVGFENYRHVFYAANIFYPLKNTSQVLLLSRKEKVVEFKWRWPPWKSGFSLVKAPLTNCNIEDGFFNLDFYKFNFSTFGNSSYTAVDQATLLNTVYLLAYAMDMFCGFKGDFNEKTKLVGLGTLLQAEPAFLNLQVSISEGETSGVMSSLIELLISDIGLTILSDYLSIKAIDPFFVSKAAKNLNIGLKCLEMLGYLNEHIPFIVDLVRGPFHVNYQYISTNGTLSQINDNREPEAEILLTPAVGFGETQVSFTIDYADDYTPVSDALFSWKWVADGSSDNEVWSIPAGNPDTVLTLSEPGRMYLRINDQTGGESQTSKKLPFYKSVGKSRIIVLAAENLIHYGYNGSGFLQDSLGYYEEGSDLKYILTHPLQSNDYSGQKFHPGILNPKTDLLVIDPSVDDRFYPYQETGNPVIEAYLDNKLAIANFVRNGGNLLFITSWNTGYEGNIIPLLLISVSDNQVIRAAYSNRQFINGAKSNISTYTAFNKIPDKSVIHLVNKNNDPLLVEMKIGQGIILNSVFKTFFTGLPGEQKHYPVNVNTFRYMIGAVFYFRGDGPLNSGVSVMVQAVLSPSTLNKMNLGVSVV